MNPTELMRAIIDAVQAKQGEPQAPANPIVNTPEKSAVLVVRDVEVDPDGQTADDETETDTFVPPLQQKLELLKKAAGIPNIYDDTECADQDGLQLAMPGDMIKQIFTQEATNEEPTDD